MPEKIPVATNEKFLQVAQISLQEAGSTVLQEINFTQQEFQKIAIAGETGSGKSTLLQTIAGLVQPSSGQVLFEQKRVKGPQEQLIPGHPGIVYLSQQFELPRFLRVEQILQYANQLEPDETETLFTVCRINHLLTRRTEHLSGGERQRIALARLLLSAPRLLLLDEPYSNLDIIHKKILKTVIHDISETLHITCLLISHDPLDTLSWANELLVMKEGRIIQRGTPEQIYRQPLNTYVAGMFGSFNFIPVAQAQAFTNLPGISSQSKNLLIRPENFTVTNSETNALTGKVVQVNFYGSYYEVEVALPDINVTVKTNQAHLATGDTIFLSILPEAVWYM